MGICPSHFFPLYSEVPTASPSVLPIGLVSPKAYLDCTRISEYPACLEIQNARLAVTAFFFHRSQASDDMLMNLQSPDIQSYYINIHQNKRSCVRYVFFSAVLYDSSLTVIPALQPPKRKRFIPHRHKGINLYKPLSRRFSRDCLPVQEGA